MAAANTIASAGAAQAANKRGSLGVGLGPSQVLLVPSACFDGDGDVKFGITGDADAVEVYINATAKVSSPSVVFCLGFCDPGTNAFVELVAAAALTDVGNTYLIVSHHAAAVTNHTAARLVRDTMVIRADHSTEGTNALTYSISATAV